MRRAQFAPAGVENGYRGCSILRADWPLRTCNFLTCRSIFLFVIVAFTGVLFARPGHSVLDERLLLHALLGEDIAFVRNLYRQSCRPPSHQPMRQGSSLLASSFTRQSSWSKYNCSDSLQEVENDFLIFQVFHFYQLRDSVSESLLPQPHLSTHR